MPDQSRAISIIFRGQDEVSDDINRISNALSSVNNDADFASQGVKDLDDSFDLVTTSGALLGRTLAGLFAGFTVAEVAQDFIEANVALERFDRGLTSISGSADRASDEWLYLTDISKTLGLEVGSIADAYLSLVAATEGTNLQGEQTRKIFESVSNAMALLGRSSADTEGALLAIQQIISKNTVSSEELKQQLGERLPGAFRIAAAAMGKTTEELTKLLEQGQLTADDFLPKFADQLQKTFGEVGYVDSFVAAQNRLKNAYSELLQELGDSGAFDLVTAGIEGLAKIVENAGDISGWSFVADGFRLIERAADAFWEKFTDRDWNLLTGILVDAKKSIDEIAAENIDIGNQLGLESIKDLGEQFDRLDEGKRIAESISDSFWNTSEAAREATKEIEKAADNVFRAQQEANRLRIELEDIASNERIANLEITAELNAEQIEADTERLQAQLDSFDARFEIQARVDIAQIEADTARVKAAFDSVTESIAGQQELLGGLYDQLGNADGLREEFRLERFIRQEQERLQEELELKKKLTEAQIREINARAAALENGEAAITINGDGLQPHLEAFMFEVLEAVQVRTNSEGLALLLGAGA